MGPMHRRPKRQVKSYNVRGNCVQTFNKSTSKYGKNLLLNRLQIINNEISYNCKYNTKSIRIWSSLIGCMSVFQVSHLVKFFDFYSAFKIFYIYGSSFFKCWTEWFCPNLNLINFEKVKKWTLTFWLKRLVNRQSGIEGSAYMLSLRDLLF